jgi:hypothetical protein
MSGPLRLVPAPLNNGIIGKIRIPQQYVTENIVLNPAGSGNLG